MPGAESAPTSAPRVLHVSQPVEAGVAAVVHDLVRAQHERGWEPVVTCPAEGWLPGVARAAGVPVRPWAASRSPGPTVPQEVRELARIVAEVDPDVVHLHSSKAGLAGRLAIRRRRPTLYQPHAWSFDAVTGPLETATRLWERIGARWTDRLVCVSADELAAGRAAGIGTPATVVPNGVDTARWQPRDRAAARARLGLPEGPLVVCVGRLAEQKGQDLLLGVWPRIRAAVPGATLALVGDGPLGDTWRARWPDPDVRWPGGGDPTDWYAAADVVALPSRWEGMALVPLEAMASGRPVVAFAVTGAAESIGETGAVVPVGDTAGLAAALVALLDDPEAAAAAGLKGRQRVVDGFDVARMADEVCALTAELVAGLRRSHS